VHAVTNDDIVGRTAFLTRGRDVMHALGARGALQLRAPRLAQADPGALLELAKALAAEQEPSGAWLVINDRVDIALMAGARGIQLAGTSMEPADAARVIVAALERNVADEATAPCVGASAHTLEEGIAARIGGASWAVVSHVLTRGRAPADAADRADASGGPALLQQLARHSGLPIVAIGGIVPQHIAPLRQLGAHGIAAIRGIWDAENAGHAAADYLSAYDAQVGG
jgi:thiamine-phosphate diphosphorylase